VAAAGAGARFAGPPHASRPKARMLSVLITLNLAAAARGRAGSHGQRNSAPAFRWVWMQMLEPDSMGSSGQSSARGRSEKRRTATAKSGAPIRPREPRSSTPFCRARTQHWLAANPGSIRLDGVLGKDLRQHEHPEDRLRHPPSQPEPWTHPLFGYAVVTSCGFPFGSRCSNGLRP
jgi:hypothetical protein